ncbi:tetratricopeptide repeat protein [Lachnospiraceae bacterium MD1]|jgi:tetratricopeptide (TPR) repeat protein|uniref:Tetratricopeptide repeat protein n=1 Tax=Variimorphobacter saccharofermentans TaxID=2755051 RepID=A0A839K2I5_9FIRM|nr:tetratricopeptide repeat protein [Variimorphobacter saccharofermentans]MBB2184024.1 tetratricopeptide repeat protein [Variimorphobacter saccharofermentans]
MKKKLLTVGLLVGIILSVTACSSAGKHYKAGREYFQEGKYEEAKASFEAAITENSNRADYYIDYGLTLIALGMYEEALEQFDQVYMDKDIMVVKENNKRVLRGRGIAYYELKQYDKAIEQFEGALDINELSEMNLDILYYMGNSLMIGGDYDKAVDTYTTILSIDKNNVTAYNSRAYCYRNLGDYEKSIADYDAAISINAAEFDSYLGKYHMLMETGKESEAEQVLALAAKIEAKTDEDRYNLAKICFFQKNYDKAQTMLNESISKGFLEAYYYIGEINRIQKDYPKAIYNYEAYIKEGKPTNPGVYNQIASCLIKSGDYNKAIEYLETGIAYQHDGYMQTLKKNEIIAYESLGDFDTAMEKMTAYLKSYPKDSEAVREAEFIKTRIMQPEEVESEE